MKAKNSVYISLKSKFLSIIRLFLASFVFIFLLGFKTYSQNTDNSFEILKNLEIFSNVYKNLQLFYVDEVQPGSLMKTGLDAMLRSLDPYTVFYPESDIEDVRMLTEGQYDGVGATIMKRDGKIIISGLFENKPAQKAGIRVGDAILKIDNIELENRNTEEVSSLLKGQINTSVSITVQRQSEILKFNVKREGIKMDNVASSRIIDGEVGYIHLSNFLGNSASEFKKTFLDLKQKGMTKLIIDLRGNGGGLLDQAVNIIELFVEKGLLAVSMKGKSSDRNQDFFTKQMPLDTLIPIVVLIDGNSASASEILAGALQDYDRAVIMGQTSFGKGLVQNVLPVAYNAQMKITTAKYYIPSGRCVQAVDYEHRDAEGRAHRLPDSLRTLFHTRNDRPVYDGLGIEPDVALDVPEYPDILLTLISKFYVFDFANNFYIKNPSIAPASEFEISDAQYNDFVNFVKQSDFSYKTSSEELLDIFEETSKEDKYYDAVKDKIDELKKVVNDEKNLDFQRYKNIITEVLNSEIISRYYYESGQTEYQYRIDNDLKTAVDFVKNPVKVQEMLGN